MIVFDVAPERLAREPWRMIQIVGLFEKLLRRADDPRALSTSLAGLRDLPGRLVVDWHSEAAYERWRRLLSDVWYDDMLESGQPQHYLLDDFGQRIRLDGPRMAVARCTAA